MPNTLKMPELVWIYGIMERPKLHDQGSIYLEREHIMQGARSPTKPVVRADARS